LIGSNDRFKKINTDSFRPVKERTYVNIGQVSGEGKTYTELSSAESKRQQVPENDDFEIFSFPPRKQVNTYPQPSEAYRQGNVKKTAPPVRPIHYATGRADRPVSKTQEKKQRLNNAGYKEKRHTPPRSTMRTQRPYNGDLSVRPPINSARPSVSEIPGARMSIREQTPAQRRKTAAAKRINPDSPEVVRSAKMAQGYRIKKKNKNARKVFIARAVLFLLIFFVTGGIFLLSFKANLTSVEASEYKSVVMYIGLSHEEKLSSSSLDTKKYIRNGVPYLNMDDVSNTFGFTVTGDKNELRYVFDISTGEYVRFKTDSVIASVNGVNIRLDDPVISCDDGLLVPLKFFEDYVNGVDVSFENGEDDGEYEIYVLRVTERNFDTGHFDKVDVGFNLNKPVPAVSIDELGLSKEILEKTYFYSIDKVS